MFSLTKTRERVVWAIWAGLKVLPDAGPTDGANVETNLHGPFGLERTPLAHPRILDWDQLWREIIIEQLVKVKEKNVRSHHQNSGKSGVSNDISSLELLAPSKRSGIKGQSDKGVGPAFTPYGPVIPIYAKKKTEEGMVDSQPMEEKIQGAKARDVGTETHGGPTEPVLQTQKTPSPSPAFIKENIDVLRTMIKEHDHQAKTKATPRRLTFSDSDKETPVRSLARNFSDRFFLKSSGTSDTRRQARSTGKSQRTPSKNKELSGLRRSRRLEDRSITKEKVRRERPKSRGKRSGHQETSSDSEYEEEGKAPSNIRVYKGNKDPDDHLSIFSAAAEQEEWPMPVWCKMFRQTLGGAVRNWFDDLEPKSVDNFKELSQKFLEEFLQQKRYAKDPTEIHGIKRRQNEVGQRERLSGGPEKAKNRGGPRETRRNIGIYTSTTTFNWNPEKQNLYKFCDYYGDRGHNTNDCYQLKKHIEEVVASRKLDHLTKKMQSSADRFLMRNVPPFGSNKPSSNYGRGRKEQNGANGFWNSKMSFAVQHHNRKDQNEKPQGENSQIRMAENDEEKTGFHTEEGVYSFTHVPKGLKNSATTFQRMMEKVLADQKERNIEVYLEEVVVKSKSEQSLVQDVEETLRKLKRVNIKIDPNTSSFGVEDGSFLGYVVTKEGIRANLEKVQAIIQSPTPKGPNQIQSLFMQLKTIGKFVPKFTELKYPINKARMRLDAATDSGWTNEAEEALQRI
nr:protein NYNRIN-like [Tanacetum cinerariifolium]